MFEFIKKCFFISTTFIIRNFLDVNSLKCVSINNQECKIRPKIININTNEPVLFL